MLEFDPNSHSFTLDGLPVPNVTRILAPLYDFDPAQGYLEDARQRGIAVHEATERHDRRVAALNPTDDPWRPDGLRGYITSATNEPYLAAWRKFLDDTGFEIHAIEEQVFSRRHRYAGILDRLGVLNGRRVVIDIKTTSAIKPLMGVQLAAYQAAVNEGCPKADQYPYRFVCQLRSDGSYRLAEFKDRADFTVFLALLTLANWKERHHGN